MSEPVDRPRVIVLNGWAAGRETWELTTFERGWTFSYLEQLDGLADQVLAAFESFILVGFSMGGTETLRLALKFPDKVRGLVLVSSTARMLEEKETNWVGMSERRLAALRLGTRLLFAADPSPLYEPTNLERGLTFLRETDLRAELEALPPDSPLRQIPVAVLQSERDGLVRAPNAAFLQHVFPQASVTRVPGGEHVLPVSAPELIDAAVSAVQQWGQAPSSLSKLAENLTKLYNNKESGLLWRPFVSALREEGVLRRVVAASKGVSRTNVLHGLDVYNNTLLPLTVGTGPSLVGTGPSLVGTGPSLVGTGPSLVGTSLVGTDPDLARFHKWDQPAVRDFCVVARLFASQLEELFSKSGNLDVFLRLSLATLIKPAQQPPGACPQPDGACPQAQSCDSAAAVRWRLNLPTGEIPLTGISPRNPLGRLSASAVDTWLRCPLTYLLEYGLGMRRVVDKVTLGPEDFGNLVHKTLELYADEQLVRTAAGFAQLSDEAEIAAALLRLAKTVQRTYGEPTPPHLADAFADMDARLTAFASVQAHWVAEGWRIAEKPEYNFDVHPFADETDVDLPFKGSVDRIDFKEGVGYRLIDYKTWTTAKGASERLFGGGENEIAHARKLALPLVTGENGEPGRFLSIQLLLYAHCLTCAAPETFKGRIVDCCYAILPQAPECATVVGSGSLITHLDAALETVRVAIRRIRASVFSPAGPRGYALRAFGGFFAATTAAELATGELYCDAQKAVDELLWLAAHPQDSFAWTLVNRLLPLRERVFPGLTHQDSVSREVARLLSEGKAPEGLSSVDGTLPLSVDLRLLQKE